MSGFPLCLMEIGMISEENTPFFIAAWDFSYELIAKASCCSLMMGCSLAVSPARFPTKLYFKLKKVRTSCSRDQITHRTWFHQQQFDLHIIRVRVITYFDPNRFFGRKKVHCSYFPFLRQQQPKKFHRGYFALQRSSPSFRKHTPNHNQSNPIHTLLIVVQGTLSGNPAFNAACLAGFWPNPALKTLPKKTSSTSFGSIMPSSADLIAIPPRSVAEKDKSPFLAERCILG